MLDVREDQDSVLNSGKTLTVDVGHKTLHFLFSFLPVRRGLVIVAYDTCSEHYGLVLSTSLLKNSYFSPLCGKICEYISVSSRYFSSLGKFLSS